MPGMVQAAEVGWWGERGGWWSVGVAAVVGLVVVVPVVLVGNGGEPGNVPEVVAQSSSLPDGIDVRESPVAVVVDEESELAPTLRLFGFRRDPGVALRPGRLLLFVGFIESGSCPLFVERIAEPPDDIHADLTLEMGQHGGDACTADARPVTFVLSLPAEPLDRIYLGQGHYVDLQPGAADGAADGATSARMTEPAAGLPRQCREAATSLGFAVPCPTRLPLIGGLRVRCGGSCVGVAGGDETEARIFVLEVEGYDASIWAPETVRHLVVEARKVQDAPAVPCYEGVPVGTLEARGREVALLECPPPSPGAEADIRHGEAIHAGHLLGYWDAHEVRYVVSVHGMTEAHRALLEQLASSIELVEP